MRIVFPYGKLSIWSFLCGTIPISRALSRLFIDFLYLGSNFGDSNGQDLPHVPIFFYKKWTAYPKVSDELPSLQNDKRHRHIVWRRHFIANRHESLLEREMSEAFLSRTWMSSLVDFERRESLELFAHSSRTTLLTSQISKNDCISAHRNQIG